MKKPEPAQQDEREPGSDPRWVRILIATLTAVAAVAGCVEQFAR